MPHSTTAEPPWFVSALPLTSEAFAFANAKHRGQRRESDFAPFILHPLEVAMLLHNRGYGDEVLAAGLLHDTVEQTDASVDEVRERFGERVARLVASLTDDPAIADPDARKEALRAQVGAAEPAARAIFAADKVAKARELRATLTRDPATTADPAVTRRLEHYRRSLEALETNPPNAALVAQLRFELWALDALPPRS